MARRKRPPKQAKPALRRAKDGTNRGRRPILADHPEVKEQILAAVAAGDTFKNAALAAGVSIHTFMMWNAKAREDVEAGRETIYTQFLSELTRAKAKGRVNLVALVQKGARDVTHVEVVEDENGNKRTKTKLHRGDWRAASWLLSVRHREQFGKVERHEVTGANGGPLDVRVEVPELTPPEDWEMWDGTVVEEPSGSNGAGGNGAG